MSAGWLQFVYVYRCRHWGWVRSLARRARSRRQCVTQGQTYSALLGQNNTAIMRGLASSSLQPRFFLASFLFQAHVRHASGSQALSIVTPQAQHTPGIKHTPVIKIESPASNVPLASWACPPVISGRASTHLQPAASAHRWDLLLQADRVDRA